MRRSALALALAVVFTGCGGGASHKPALRLLKGPQSCVPKAGAGTMGACTPKLKSAGQPRTVSGPLVPDVSYYQGTIDWRVARGRIAGAIVRVADGSFVDPQFARNWRELRRLGIWHAAYYFLRPGNCAAQADRALALVGRLDSGPLIADAEVPLNYGCAAAFVERIKQRTGTAEVIYTAPGTWAGGPHGHALLWVASYGPTPGCVWTCSHVAWQYTNGEIGPFPHTTAIGHSDISTDNGITRLGAGPTPAERRQAKVRQLGRERSLIRELHGDVGRHHCRKGAPWYGHAKPARYHTLCGRWLAKGKLAHARAQQLERELRR